MYYACNDHMEMALDMIIDEQEVAPVINKIEGENELSTTCSFCENAAVYSITG